jgi:hypothetical protein
MMGIASLNQSYKLSIDIVIASSEATKQSRLPYLCFQLIDGKWLVTAKSFHDELRFEEATIRPAPTSRPTGGRLYQRRAPKREVSQRPQ